MTIQNPTQTPAAPTPAVLLRRPEVAIRYSLRHRVADWWAGRRDGRVDLASLTIAATGSGQPPTAADLTCDSTAWLRHNEHHRDERLAHEQLVHATWTLDLSIAHDRTTHDLESAITERKAAQTALDTIQPLTEDGLTRRGPAEASTPEDIIRARRAREHHRTTLAPARQRLAAADAAVQSLTAHVNHLTAQLDSLTRLTHTRQARISEHHNRRTATYQRAYLRAHHKSFVSASHLS